MERWKTKWNEMAKTEKAVLFLWAVAVLLLVGCMRPGEYDDTASKELTAGYSVWQWMVYRYNNWSARSLQEAMGFFMIWHPVLWRGITAVLLYMIPLMLAGILQFRIVEIPCCIFAVMLFPLTYMATAGWICTSITYLWPVAFALGYFWCVQRYMRRNQRGALVGLPATVLLVLAVDHELLAVLMATILIYCVVRYYRGNKRLPILLLVHFGLCCAKLVFVLTSPGNQIRSTVEVRWFEGYDSFTAVQKFYLGVVRVYVSLAENQNPVFYVLCIVMAAAAFLVLQKTWQRFLGCLPLLIMVLLNEIPSNCRFGQIASVDLHTWKSYIPVAVLAVFLFCMTVTLYAVFRDHMQDAWLAWICLYVGMATAGVLGFSPTIYVSGDRTLTFMLFSFVFVILLLIRRIWSPNILSAKEKGRTVSLFFGLAAWMCMIQAAMIIAYHMLK